MDDFDPVKEEKNLAKHQISLGRSKELRIERTIEDDRIDYGERRFRAYGILDGRPYCLVFTFRNDVMRPISLRRVHSKEYKRYVP